MNTNLKSIYNLIIIALLAFSAYYSLHTNQVIRESIQTEIRDYKHTEWVKAARMVNIQSDTLATK